MSEQVISEVIFALRSRRDVFEASNSMNEAQRYQRYCDSLHEGMGVARGVKRSPEDLKRIRLDIFSVSDPSLLERIMPFPRNRQAYNAVLKLGGRVERVEAGLPPRKLLGLFG